MTNAAFSFFSEEIESNDAGRTAGEALLRHFGAGQLKAVLVYATMNHDQPVLLAALRETVGKDVLILGCSVQGTVSNDLLTEDGFALGVMGFGGDIECSIAIEREIQDSPTEKGRRLAQALKRDLGSEPKIVILIYDPLCGIDVEAMLEGVRPQIDCALVGGAAGQPWGIPQQTFQYWGDEVLSKGVVGLAISGTFDVELGLCHGTVPTGIASVITKADGNRILEIDGRPAVEVWRETTGCGEEEMAHQSHFAAWALGVEVAGPDGQTDHVIRGAFGFDLKSQAIIFQAAIPAGTRVMLHHRTVEKVLQGTEVMAEDLAKRLDGCKPWAALGFECAARTYPFLGQSNTRREHEQLRAAVAPNAQWLGMMAWGEIGPCAQKPSFHNYTYLLAVLTE